jgi:small nuclear ribonucleoprotein (snRNP)-like protein
VGQPKVKMFRGTLFQVEESVNAFLGEVDERGFEKHTLEFSTIAIQGETIVQAVFYSD